MENARARSGSADRPCPSLHQARRVPLIRRLLARFCVLLISTHTALREWPLHGSHICMPTGRNCRTETYAEALAQHHPSSEAKFENGQFLDRGRTQRRRTRLASCGKRMRARSHAYMGHRFTYGKTARLWRGGREPLLCHERVEPRLGAILSLATINSLNFEQALSSPFPWLPSGVPGMCHGSGRCRHRSAQHRRRRWPHDSAGAVAAQ
jgi:hypothetical protein